MGHTKSPVLPLDRHVKHQIHLWNVLAATFKALLNNAGFLGPGMAPASGPFLKFHWYPIHDTASLSLASDSGRRTAML